MRKHNRTPLLTILEPSQSWKCAKRFGKRSSSISIKNISWEDKETFPGGDKTYSWNVRNHSYRYGSHWEFK